MATQVIFGNEAKDNLLEGIDILNTAVSSTLGPKGHTVAIMDNYSKPKTTKDGITVADSISLNNSYKNVGVQLLKEAAKKTVEVVGDGTTTSIILASSMIKNGLVYKGEGYRIYRTGLKDIAKGISIAAELVVDKIKEKAIPIRDIDIKHIATISSNNDKEIGELIYEAFSKIGKDGLITVDESNSLKTSVEVIQGMRFERGYEANHFVTDQEKGLAVLDNPYIIISDQQLNYAKDIENIFNLCIDEGRPLLIIAQGYNDAALEVLKVNHLRGIIKVCAIKAPEFGEFRKKLLEDISILTKGTYVSYDSAIPFRDITPDMLGTCNKVIVSKDTTTLLGCPTTKDDLSSYIIKLKNEYKELNNIPEKQGSYQLEFLQKRISRLSGGIARIAVGGTTELEMHEKKDRIDDAVCATKAATEEGVVLGGGLTYYNIAESLVSSFKSGSDLDIGFCVVKDALKQVFITICDNAEQPYKKLGKKLTDEIGYNANTGEFVNMYEAGILDTAKGLRVAFENAVSVALQCISMSCMVVPVIETRLLS